MPDPYTLAQMRAFALETLDMLERQETRAHVQHAAVAAQARALADRVAQPVTFGVVGEFSVGKSLLLGTLLGKADLLPVENRKATGNITVLRLHPYRPPTQAAGPAVPSGPEPADRHDPDPHDPAPQATAPHATDPDATDPARGAHEPAPPHTYASPTAEIHYLTAERLGECVRWILDRLADGLDAEHPELGAGAVLRGYDPLTDPEGWTPFDRWMTCLWPSAGPGRPDPAADPTIRIASSHRAAAAELCRIRDAFQSQNGVLGKRREVAAEHLRDALDHGAEERVPSVVPRPRLRPFGLDDVVHDPEALSRSFVLIERVVQDVYVAPGHWELDGLLAEHPVQFLDFPGIGGAGSYGRDTHLSRSELAEVHTILVVIDAPRAGSEEVGKFWNMLAGDDRSVAALGKAALVAAGSFDLVPVPTLPDEPVGAGELLRRSDELNSIHVHSDTFVRGREEAVLLTSAVAAIRRYQLPYAGLSQQSRDHIGDALRTIDAKGGTPDWYGVAERFAAADPGSPWPGRLRAAADDGGIRALQRLIEDHLRANGVALKQERAERARRLLWERLEALNYQVRQERGPTAAGTREVRRMVDRLGRYRALLAVLMSQLDALRGHASPRPPAAAAPAPDGTAPAPAVAAPPVGAGGFGPAGDPDLPGASDGPAARVAALDPPPDLASAAAQVHREVYEWGEWDLLLKRAVSDARGLVTKSAQPRATADFDVPLPGETSAPEPRAEGFRPTDTTRNYITRFTALVDAHAEDHRRRLDAWFDGWQKVWQAEFAPLREWFTEPATLPLLREVYLAHLGDPGDADLRVRRLWAALHPEGVVARQADDGDGTAGGHEDVADRFPGLPDHALPWHHALPDLDPMTESQERHPLVVATLRRHTADCAAAVVTERLNALLTARAEALHAFYEEAASYVLAEHEIRPPRGGTPGDPDDPDDPAPAGSGGPAPATDPAAGAAAGDGDSAEPGPGSAVPDPGSDPHAEDQPVEQLLTKWRQA